MPVCLLVVIRVIQRERELKKHNISDTKLSQKLGEISREIVCDNCKETKSPLLDYTALDSEGKKKKFCSVDCKIDWKNKKKDDSPTKSGGKFGVVIKCNNNKQLNITDSGLSTKQQTELTQQLKSTVQPITYSEVSKEFDKDKNKKNDNAGIIGTHNSSGNNFRSCYWCSCLQEQKKRLLKIMKICFIPAWIINLAHSQQGKRVV
ncbi:1907_t:CDS:2 [Scutellospora calospora]|uniref:1907_t:CDS:1 n=1 Tax=Scutellospora calospora TaxID=85575 RepID=A0ACA9KH86_9GLOM|nr:1907_t:CDS:2 [Scutellospora calospora]